MSDQVDIPGGEGFEAFPRRVVDAWPSPTATGGVTSITGGALVDEPPAVGPGAVGTILPPYADPLSPYQRAKIDAVLRQLEQAAAELRRLRDAS